MPASSANSRTHLCPACLRTARQFWAGPDGRPDARCPHCGSLERHRFLVLVLEGLSPAIATARVALDIGPNEQTATLFKRLRPERYLRMDVDPAADEREVDVRASLTHVPLADASVDVAVCYHVLEHIPDDRAAMAELARVLAPAGLALVQVPWRPGTATDEDPAAPEAERIRRFGRPDHVRYYGGDFEERLRAAGLSFIRFTPREVVGDHLVEVLRLVPEESVWLVRRAEGHLVREINGGALRQTALAVLASAGDRLERDVAELRSRARAAEKQAARWERAYRRLRGRLPVRIAAAIGRLLRRSP